MKSSHIRFDSNQVGDHLLELVNERPLQKTLALRDPEVALEVIERYPGQVAVSLCALCSLRGHRECPFQNPRRRSLLGMPPEEEVFLIVQGLCPDYDLDGKHILGLQERLETIPDELLIGTRAQSRKPPRKKNKKN